MSPEDICYRGLGSVASLKHWAEFMTLLVPAETLFTLSTASRWISNDEGKGRGRSEDGLLLSQPPRSSLRLLCQFVFVLTSARTRRQHPGCAHLHVGAVEWVSGPELHRSPHFPSVETDLFKFKIELDLSVFCVVSLHLSDWRIYVLLY